MLIKSLCGNLPLKFCFVKLALLFLFSYSCSVSHFIFPSRILPYSVYWTVSFPCRFFLPWRFGEHADLYPFSSTYNPMYFPFLASICCSFLWCTLLCGVPQCCQTTKQLLNPSRWTLWGLFCLWGSEFWEEGRFLKKRGVLQLKDMCLERGTVHLLLCVTQRGLEVVKICEDSW